MSATDAPSDVGRHVDVPTVVSKGGDWTSLQVAPSDGTGSPWNCARDERRSDR